MSQEKWKEAVEEFTKLLVDYQVTYKDSASHGLLEGMNILEHWWKEILKARGLSVDE